MDRVTLPSKDRKAALHIASTLSAKTDTSDPNPKDYLCFVPAVNRECA